MSTSFSLICLLHAMVATISGVLMIFYLHDLPHLTHNPTVALKLRGSTPHDRLLLQASDSFAGLSLVGVGVLLFLVSFVNDRDFEGFFAKGCVLIHAGVAVWRVCVERRVEGVEGDWGRKVVGDLVLGCSWVLFIVNSWKEKYD